MFKKVVAIASVTALLAATPAFAHGYRHEDWGHHDRGANGALIALGAFAAFAGVAAVLSAQHQEAPPVAYAPPPAYPAPAYYAPAPAYYAPAPVYYAPAYPAQN